LQVSAHRAGDALELTVEDDGPGFDSEMMVKPGHGIDNTRERLRALYGARASLTFARSASGGTKATLRVPWREISVESDLAER
jgi:signal transduction histidine kinase